MKTRFITYLLLCSMMMMGQSAYISRVYEYVPAPGQFINQSYPAYKTGDTYETILQKVETALVGADGSDWQSLIVLGAWGGYVTFGFDHDITNVAGEQDFQVLGNSFYTGVTERGVYGSYEPGIIYVSRDDNGDGLPNDTWYEIAGSEWDNTIHDYAVTYHQSNGNVPWEDNKGAADSVYRNKNHKQKSYYPLWRSETEYTLSGSLLPCNIDENMLSYRYGFGYADNLENDSIGSGIDIDWARTAEGEPAHLESIRFVRVQTGVMADWGQFGEVSTEVAGAKDLHPTTSLFSQTTSGSAAGKIVRDGQVVILRNGVEYSPLGIRIR